MEHTSHIFILRVFKALINKYFEVSRDASSLLCCTRLMSIPHYGIKHVLNAWWSGVGVHFILTEQLVHRYFARDCADSTSLGISVFDLNRQMNSTETGNNIVFCTTGWQKNVYGNVNVVIWLAAMCLGKLFDQRKSGQRILFADNAVCYTPCEK